MLSWPQSRSLCTYPIAGTCDSDIESWEILFSMSSGYCCKCQGISALWQQSSLVDKYPPTCSPGRRDQRHAFYTSLQRVLNMSKCQLTTAITCLILCTLYLPFVLCFTSSLSLSVSCCYLPNRLYSIHVSLPKIVFRVLSSIFFCFLEFYPVP